MFKQYTTTVNLYSETERPSTTYNTTVQFDSSTSTGQLIDTAKRMKIDPYYRRQKCSPIVSGNIRHMRIFAGVPWVGASNDSGVVDDGNFLRFGWTHLRKR